MDRQTRMAFVCVVILMLVMIGSAFAKPVAIAEGNGSSLTLHDTPCELEKWQYAEYRYANGKVVKGCWSAKDGLVLAVFVDGDFLPVRIDAFRPVTAL